LSAPIRKEIERLEREIRETKGEMLKMEWAVIMRKNEFGWIFKNHYAFRDFRELQRVREYNIKDTCRECKECERLDNNTAVFHLVRDKRGQPKKVGHRTTVVCRYCHSKSITAFYKRKQRVVAIFEGDPYAVKRMTPKEFRGLREKRGLIHYYAEEYYKYSPELERVHQKVKRNGCPRGFSITHSEDWVN